MSDQLVQALVTIVTAFFGYEAVRRSVLTQMHNKVDVVVYQTAVRELHDKINSQNQRITVLETEARK